MASFAKPVEIRSFCRDNLDDRAYRSHVGDLPVELERPLDGEAVRDSLEAKGANVDVPSKRKRIRHISWPRYVQMVASEKILTPKSEGAPRHSSGNGIRQVVGAAGGGPCTKRMH